VTRKSRRELERDLDDLEGGSHAGDYGAPLTPEERAALGNDADAWDETPTSRAVFRMLAQAAQEAEA